MTRIPSDTMSHELSKLEWSKRTWLENFSTGRNARPSHEIERVQLERRVLEQARDDYARSHERKGEAA